MHAPCQPQPVAAAIMPTILPTVLSQNTRESPSWCMLWLCLTLFCFLACCHSHTDAAEMFYFFFEARNNSDTGPLALWLTGGPGCSSELAVFVENGPYALNDKGEVEEREFAWDVEVRRAAPTCAPSRGCQLTGQHGICVRVLTLGISCCHDCRQT
jgi:Serine carboxypeptidase